MTATTEAPLVDEALGLVDQLSALLAIDGLLAGPAELQESTDDLIVSDAIIGCVATLSDGSGIAVLASLEGVQRLTGGNSSEAMVAAMAEPMAVIAASHNRTVATIEPVHGKEAIPGIMSPVPGLRILAGAGVFEGEVPIAAIGCCRSSIGSMEAGSASSAGGGGAALPAASAAMPGVTSGMTRNLHLLSDVTLAVTAELGSTSMTMGHLLDLQPGGVVELDREAGAPIDLYVNGTLIARGEVVVADGNYAVRVTDVVADGDER